MAGETDQKLEETAGGAQGMTRLKMRGGTIALRPILKTRNGRR